MQFALDLTDRPTFSDYSDVIDVRAPAEYRDDHIPGAINLPVLDDDQRARVGTLHKQNPFAARRLGAALVSANIADLLTRALSDKEADYRPLLYCWRGGMRSRSLAIVLRQIGWQAVLLDGGYRRYRHGVRETLRRDLERLRLYRIAGPTGSGKTALLAALAAAGAQTLDLERLAGHRGSVLGAEPALGGVQPTQKYFESLLADALADFDLERPVWVESESSKIGRIHLPAELWQNMKAARVARVDVPAAARIDFLLEQYRHFVDDPELLKERLAPLAKHAGKTALQEWYALIDRRRWPEFVGSLLDLHYDRVYRSQREDADDGYTLTVTALDEAGLKLAARRLLADFQPAS